MHFSSMGMLKFKFFQLLKKILKQNKSIQSHKLPAQEQVFIKIFAVFTTREPNWDKLVSLQAQCSKD